MLTDLSLRTKVSQIIFLNFCGLKKDMRPHTVNPTLH